MARAVSKRLLPSCMKKTCDGETRIIYIYIYTLEYLVFERYALAIRT